MEPVRYSELGSWGGSGIEMYAVTARSEVAIMSANQIPDWEEPHSDIEDERFAQVCFTFADLGSYRQINPLYYHLPHNVSTFRI